jgi:hypothetical protein
MNTSTTSRTRRTFGRAKKLWAEMDYAQRRLLEIRTGVPLSTPEETKARHDQAEVAELERLYALDASRDVSLTM